jgi:hypothetical protein
MVIFFRFHSATYFYNAWSIYRVWAMNIRVINHFVVQIAHSKWHGIKLQLNHITCIYSSLTFRWGRRESQAVRRLVYSWDCQI